MTSSESSKISSEHLSNKIGLMTYNSRRHSTNQNYQRVWRLFNKFIIKLDIIPDMWEQKTALFIVYMTEKGCQSTTLKSYISAIKATLQGDGYKWDDKLVLLGSLTKACKINNDRIKVNLPISCKLLELLLFEVDKYYKGEGQYYLCILYKTILAIGYYGLFRIGELVTGTQGDQHTIKAKNVHIAQNKDKIMIVLYSSKTTGGNCRPQKVKINGINNGAKTTEKFFCPFRLIREYSAIRGNYVSEYEPFFCFKGGIPILHNQVSKMMKLMFTKLHLDGSLYSPKSLRSGRASDMLRYGYSIEQIQRAGRWKSNAVFNYLRT